MNAMDLSLEVNKTHDDWLDKLSFTLLDPRQGIVLVQYFTTWAKTTFLLLNLSTISCTYLLGTLLQTFPWKGILG